MLLKGVLWRAVAQRWACYRGAGDDPESIATDPPSARRAGGERAHCAYTRSVGTIETK